MAWAVEHQLPATKKIVLLMLANRVNSDTGKCVPKIKTLAADCGLSESATKSALRDLSEMGLIKVHQRFYEGQQLPNQYELLTDWVGQQKTPSSLQKTQVGHQAATESGKEPVKEPTTPSALEERFETFWKAYPRKVSKDAARKAFAKRKPTEELLNNMIGAIAKQRLSDQWVKDGGQYIPHPSTWLNNGSWMDEDDSNNLEASNEGMGHFV